MLLGLLTILTGHVLTDYLLQRKYLGKYKKRSIKGLVLHTLSWTLSISPGLIILKNFNICIFIFLLLSHFMIDWCKNKLFPLRHGLCTPVNIIDQFLHLVSIALTFIIF
ncbi:DUF3307 domain-containing protein [Desulfoscipio geothermicus]|uniref:DUF3307 domain-containing protein n=1 Tax=Desulfoscipio geothermicus DSM 3669 TaxID=1121426 RepID=A0A1I6EKJ0_9FIRM|nr:Protein of unknown function [Desulfoscipio geothermicus DSM 3669]